MHVFLIGYRGSGKSTVGRLLSGQIQWPTVDTDVMIEAQSDHTIREIFEREGEAGFRDREELAVAQAAERPSPTIIALGGGAILREANRQQIRNTGLCVWLKGSAEALYARTAADTSTRQRRPDLSASGGYDEVVELLAAREPIYQELAQLTVATDGRTPDEIATEIAVWVKKNE